MVNYAYRSLFYQDNIQKNIHIYYGADGHIDRELLYDGEFELTENLSSGNEIRFGSCEGSILKFKISSSTSSLEGKQLTVKLEVDGHSENMLQIGLYTVKSDIPTADKSQRVVTAYDSMSYILNVDASSWYNELLPDANTTVTLLQFRNSFITYCGLESVERELANDSMVVTRTISPSEIYGKDIITAICEINGVFGHINREGKFDYIELDTPSDGLLPSNDLYPSNSLYPSGNISSHYSQNRYVSCKYEDYTVSKITCLKIRQTEQDVGATSGTGTNTYIVENNFLVYGKDTSDLQTIADNLYSVINKMQFVPATVNCLGDPCLEVGDIANIILDSGVKHTYVFSRTIKGVNSLTDVISSKSSKNQTVNVNSQRTQYKQLKGKIATVQLTVEQISSEVKDLEDGSASIIQQLSNSINAKVSANGGSTSFSWHLESDKFELKSNNNVVFKCDSGGITVNGYATASSLNALSATVGTINSNYLSTYTASITYGTISSLNAVDAKIDTLSAKSITTENFTSQKITAGMVNSGVISASKITTGTLSVDRLNVGDIVGKLTTQTITCVKIDCTSNITAPTGNITACGITTLNGVNISNLSVVGGYLRVS